MYEMTAFCPSKYLIFEANKRILARSPH